MSKTGIKTKDLRPCDKCGGSINPIFYQVKISMRQMAIDKTAVNQVLGTAQILGGNLALGSMMSPNADAAIELPGYQVDMNLFICQSCLLGKAGVEPFAIRPIDWMIQSETGEEETP